MHLFILISDLLQTYKYVITHILLFSSFYCSITVKDLLYFTKENNTYHRLTMIMQLKFDLIKLQEATETKYNSGPNEQL